MNAKNALIIFSACSILFACVSLKKGRKKASIGTTSVISLPDSSIDTSRKKAILRPYKEVITSKAITYTGVIKVHKIDDRYLFEIPDSILNADILVVNRISKSAAGNRPADDYLGFAGDQIGRSVIAFEKGPNNKLFIRLISYIDRSYDSSANGLFRSVRASNLNPIVASFDIKANAPNSSGYVIDMTDYLNGDNSILFFSAASRKVFGLGSIQQDKSYIMSVKPFPTNVEVSTTKTFVKEDGFLTYELNSSIILLPGKPMTPRFADDRVGYFKVGYNDFDAPVGVEPNYMITRWRLEPKSEDIEKYMTGELVEPVKPIVYYIDPATPQKWISYLIAGVNDWQRAFEKAGFKNVIYALPAPVNDTTWSIDDARHNVIVYKPSVAMNASGPQINDPRTGEILETHINWYHNILKLIQTWYFIQASVSDPRGRTLTFSDTLMGRLIRYVVSHEVGHTLGLRHNFGASSTVPVEKLRDKAWVEKNGISPSIMDYSRFNYVAQPDDHIGPEGLLPHIGPYDEWAIEWGYKWLTKFPTKEAEKSYMNSWIVGKLEENPSLWFGDEQGVIDPRRQSEDIGNNAMKAGEYGIKNLQLVYAKLWDWIKQPNEDYSDLNNLQIQILLQYRRYLYHALNYIGGIESTAKTAAQKGLPIEFVPRTLQKEAVKFLQKELFNTPLWFNNKSIIDLTGRSFLMDNVMYIQIQVLTDMTSQYMLTNLLTFQSNDPANAYTVEELFTDLEQGIWKELKSAAAIDIYRRNLQKGYIDRLLSIIQLIPQGGFDGRAGLNLYTDVVSIAKAHLKSISKTIKAKLPAYKDQMTIIHLNDILERIDKVMNGGKEKETAPQRTDDKKAFKRLSDNYLLDNPSGYKFKLERGCWDDR